MADATPAQMKASMDEWTAWRDVVGGENVEFGNPVNAGKCLEGTEVTDSTTTVSGYSILKADSLDDAADLLADHPHLKMPGCSIEVLEFLPMPGL